MSALSYPAFLQLLSAKNPRKGFQLLPSVVPGRTLIRFRSTSCPVTCLSETSAWNWQEEAEDLGLDEDVARAIVNAADDQPNHDPQVRADLLAACGLTERAE